MYSSAMLWLASFPVFVRRTSSLDRASAMLSCPGLYVMVYSQHSSLYTCRRFRPSSIQNFQRAAVGYEPEHRSQQIHAESFTSPHYTYSVSFSVWLYRVSTSVRIPLAYAMKTNSPFCFCTSTAPNPTGLASVITCVSVSLSK